MRVPAEGRRKSDFCETRAESDCEEGVNWTDKASVQAQLAFDFNSPAMMIKPRPSEVKRIKAPSSLVAADLFCGAGGLSFGFQQAGFQIAFANDINEDYAKTYKLNHEGTTFFQESIEDLTTSKIF